MRYIEMAPQSYKKNGKKSTITIEYKHKKREKSLLNKKKSPFYRILRLLGISDIITSVYLFYLFNIQSYTK